MNGNGNGRGTVRHEGAFNQRIRWQGLKAPRKITPTDIDFCMHDFCNGRDYFLFGEAKRQICKFDESTWQSLPKGQRILFEGMLRREAGALFLLFRHEVNLRDVHITDFQEVLVRSRNQQEWIFDACFLQQFVDVFYTNKGEVVTWLNERKHPEPCTAPLTPQKQRFLF